MDLQSFIYPIIIAILSGVSFLAYKHPRGYKNIFYVVFPMSLVIVFNIMFFSISNIYTTTKGLKENLENDTALTLESQTVFIKQLDKTTDFLVIFSIVSFLASAYLYFLYKLPNILEIK